MTVRIHFGFAAPETGLLTCAHCKLPHPVTEEMQKRYEENARRLKVPPDGIWECGKCWLAHFEHLTGSTKNGVKTDCAHPVPPFKD